MRSTQAVAHQLGQAGQAGYSFGEDDSASYPHCIASLPGGVHAEYDIQGAKLVTRAVDSRRKSIV